MKTILVPAHFADSLRPVADKCGVELVPYDADGKIAGEPREASALFRWWLSEEQGDRFIREHPLEWIHTGSAGVDHILTPAFLESHIILTNSAGVHAPSIAEWVVGMMLAELKNFRNVYEQQQAQVWEKVERDELSGKRVVILGAGRIAREIATRLAPFGVSLLAIGREPRTDPLLMHIAPATELARVVASADWLIVAAPLTSETRGMVSAEILAALPPSARLINVSRGEIVDEAALEDSLRDRRLAGAVLDVFETEPLPVSHAFWKLDSVTVLPHTTWRSPLVRGRQLALFSENLTRFSKGEALLNVVDPRRGY